MDGYSPVAPIHSTVTDKVYFAVQDVLDGRKFKVFLKPTDMGKLKVQKIRRTLAQTTGYDLESIVLQSGDRTLSDEMTGVMFDLNPTTVLNMKVLQQSSRTVHPFSRITSPVHSNANGTDQRMNVSTVSGISPIKRYSVDRSPIPSVTRAFSYGRQQHGNSGNSSLSHTPKRIKSLSPRPSHQCTTRSNGTSLSDGLNSMLLNDDSNYINMKGVVRSISAITTPSNPNRVDSRSYSEKSLSARKHPTQYTGSKTRDHATAHKNPHYPGVYPTSEKKVYPNERSKDTSRSNENGEEINDPKQSHDMASLTDLETTIAQLTETNALLQLEVGKYMYQADQSMLECEKLRLTLDHIFATRLDKDENAHLKLSLQLSEEKIKNANLEKAHHILLEQLRSETKHRKKLEGILEDFEGPIHVMMRLRPVIAKEPPNFAEGRVSISSEGNSIVVTTPGIGSRTFQFHHCFGEGTSTLDIFLDIKPSLRRFLDGVNSCILAYGQTNAGKSFTMLGSLCSKVESNESESTGMISYIVQDIFDALDSCDGSELEYNVSCTVLESYNEVIRDLSSGVKVEVRSLPTGVNSIGAMRHQLLDVEQSMELLSKTIAAQRPRSHLIVSIYVSIRNRSQSQSIVSQTCSTITLVDLAGCERVSRNVSNKDKVSETQSVNKSLSALGDVIAAMSQGCYPKHRLGGSSSTNSPQHNVSSASALQSITSSTFVPFRNSKLTLLLQETLQAQLCRVWWIGCIAPAALGTANLNETMATLTFSGRLLRSNR